MIRQARRSVRQTHQGPEVACCERRIALGTGIAGGGEHDHLAHRRAAGVLEPVGRVRRDNHGRAGADGDLLVAVVEPAKAHDAAWEAAKWYTSAEFQKLHYKRGIGGVVARTMVLQSEEYLTAAIPREWNEFFAKGVAFLRGPSKRSNWPEIDAALDKELTAFQNGQEPAAAATARMAPVITALLKEGQIGQ